MILFGIRHFYRLLLSFKGSSVFSILFIIKEFYYIIISYLWLVMSSIYKGILFYKTELIIDTQPIIIVFEGLLLIIMRPVKKSLYWPALHIGFYLVRPVHWVKQRPSRETISQGFHLVTAQPGQGLHFSY